MPPTVSVIIPTYNHRRYVEETLASVFAQSFSDYEVIVINDGSPDDTAQVLQPYAAAGRIRYIEQTNAGQSRARNRGLEEARGEYVAFLDDDDLWMPDKLEWQVASLRGDPKLGVVFGGNEGFSEGGAWMPPQRYVQSRIYRFEDFMLPNPILSPGQALMRTDVVRGVGGFDATIWGADDWDLYLRLIRTATFLGDSRVALRYRWHAANASRNSARMRRNELRVARRHFFNPAGQGTLRQWRLLRVAIAGHYRGLLAASGHRSLAAYEHFIYYALRALNLPDYLARKRRCARR